LDDFAVNRDNFITDRFAPLELRKTAISMGFNLIAKQELASPVS